MQSGTGSDWPTYLQAIFSGGGQVSFLNAQDLNRFVGSAISS
ncbi:hypothetical protein [Bacillus cereus]|nr:hypothetical protein [Bacillus cereus]